MMTQAATEKRVVVIGGGIMGICAASWLLRDGHDVTVVEPAAVASGASFGNAGCFNYSSIVPMSMPGNLWNVPLWLLDPLGPLAIRWRYLPTLTPWLIKFLRAGTLERVQRQAAALTPLLAGAFASYAPLVRNAGAERFVAQDGHLVVYRSEKDFQKDALAWRLRRENGVQYETLSDGDLWDFEPSLSRDRHLGVFISGNGHTVNPEAFTQSLADAFQRDGGRILKARALGFEIGADGRLRSVKTDMGQLSCESAVVSAGAHSRAFAEQLGDKIPLDTERGYHVVIRDPECRPRTPTMDALGKFVATPMEMGLRLAGTVEFAGLEAAPNWRRSRILLTLGRKLFPKLRETYAEGQLSLWMGFRPSMPDSMPVIGPSARSNDIIYAFGHGHVGMTAGATTGRVVADLIAGRRSHIPIDAFSPGRFSSRTRQRSGSDQEAGRAIGATVSGD